MTEQTPAGPLGTWSYRPGAWFGVFGAATTLLLPASEKARVGDLWARIDDGAGFDVVLDALLQSGLGSLPGFVLVGQGEGPTRILVRGATVRATIRSAAETVELEGSAASTWVERTVADVTALSVSVDGADPEGLDLPIHGGLVRVGRVDHPPYADGAAAPVAAGAPVIAAAPVVADEPVEAPVEELAAAVDEQVVDEPAPEPTPGPLPEPTPAAALDQADPAATELLDMSDVEAATSAPEPTPAPGPVEPEPVEQSAAEVPAPPAYDPFPSVPEAPRPPSPPAWPGSDAPPPPPPFAPSLDAPAGPPPASPPPVSPPPFAVDPLGGPSPFADADHDGLTQSGAEGDEFARAHPGIPGQPMAPNVGRSVARLVISNGETVDVDRVVLIGRAPEARRFTTTDQPRLVTVPSPLHEISSTHVEVRPGSGADHGSAVVTDMGSTNGTVLVQPGLSPEELKPGIAVQLIPGATINLGDGVTIQVTHP
jgi:hypothetical protein